MDEIEISIKRGGRVIARRVYEAIEWSEHMTDPVLRDPATGIALGILGPPGASAHKFEVRGFVTYLPGDLSPDFGGEKPSAWGEGAIAEDEL